MRKFMFCAILFVGVSLSLDPALHSEGPVDLSFTDALMLAKSRSVDLVVADERIKQAMARQGQAFSFLMPQLSGELSQKRQTRNLEAFGIKIPGTASQDPVVGPFNSFDARIRLSQMIFDLAAIERLLSVRAGEKLSQAQYRKAEGDVLALVANLYLEAWRAGQKVDLARSFVERDRMRLRISHGRFRTGTTTALEVKEAKAYFKGSVSALHGSLFEVKEREYDLKTALGIPLGQSIVLNDRKTFADFGIPSENEILGILDSHPDMDVAKNLLKQRQVEQRIAIAEYLPRLGFVADYGLSGEDPSRSEATYSFGVEATMPIFDGGNRYFRSEEAKSRSRESESTLRDTQNKLEAKIRIAVQGLGQTMELMNAKDAEFLVAQKKLRLMGSRFHNGSASEWEYVLAGIQNGLVKDDRNEAIAAYLLARANLAHAMGRMDKLLNEG